MCCRLAYSNEKNKETMEKAAGILVRREANTKIDGEPRFIRTFHMIVGILLQRI